MIYGPLSDSLLDGRYRVGEIIGSGGFGTVYAAMHVGLFSKVAIKVPRVDDLAPKAIPDAIARFLEEGRTLKRLRHPSLVAALDVGLLPPEPDGLALPYLVLEWCEGPTLKEWRAARPGSLSPTEAWFILRPAFEAIAHAHEEGIAHRDIKPANILMEETRDGGVLPRVIDFGIAKVVGPAEEESSGATRTTSAHRAFTPKYAAPEQLTGMRTGPRSDVYALALVLVETITGRSVFASDEEARRAVVEGDMPTPEKLGVDLGGFEAVVERALSAKPMARYADAGAFIRALEGEPEAALETGVSPVGDTNAPAPHALSTAFSTPPTPSPTGSSRSAARGDASRDGWTPPPLDPDESMVPSSHTLRTHSDARAKPSRVEKPRLAIALGAGATLLLTAFVLVVLFPAGGLAALRRMQTRPPTSASADASARPPGEQIDAPLRPLNSLDGAQLRERAEAGGMTQCKAVEASGITQVFCSEGQVWIRDGRSGLSKDDETARNYLQYQAKGLAIAGRVARFAMDGAVGLIVACPPSMVDQLTERLLAGVRHGPIGTEVVPKVDVAIPPRLSQWKGPELAARVLAIGGEVTSDMPAEGTSLVQYMLDGEVGTIMLVDGGDAWVSTTKAGSSPFSYALDGNRVMACFGTSPSAKTGKVDMVRKLLGSTKATTIAAGK